MNGIIARIGARVLTATALIVCALTAWPGGSTSWAASSTSVDWTLESTTGDKVRFHDQLSQGPVVVGFWATWCKPCLKELPHLNELAEKYAGQVTILAVSTDAPKSTAKVAPFIQAKGYTDLTVLLDPGADLQNLLQVGNIVPFLVMFDREGREIFRHVGYKDGDEIELEHHIQAALETDGEVRSAATPPADIWAGAVTATDRFEYSYDTHTKQEIVENWLDVSYQFGGFRTGILYNSQGPSEEGYRTGKIKHRFFEFNAERFAIRAGHFYGLFGRGLVFNSYEDRTVRVDTRLDGSMATYAHGRVSATVLSGSPQSRDLDIRAVDFEYNLVSRLRLAATGMTYRPDTYLAPDGTVHRENVRAVRLRDTFSFGDFYLERGWKTGYDFDPTNDHTDLGTALYMNVNLHRGPFSASWEMSDYDKFEVVSRADGITALNRPPALAREFTWTLLNRAPHTLNANDERGQNLDLMYTGGNGWTLLASGANIQHQDGSTVYQLGYFSVEKERFGDFRFLGAFGYQESEGLRQTAATEITWFADPNHSVTFQAEQQHVRVGGGPGFDLGAYDQQWFKLEYGVAPHWSVGGFLETNNKFDIQRTPNESPGPYPAGQITYTISQGGNLNLWLGKRQAGFLCSGGVCKFEPAFEGIEFFGMFRY